MARNRYDMQGYASLLLNTGNNQTDILVGRRDRNFQKILIQKYVGSLGVKSEKGDNSTFYIERGFFRKKEEVSVDDTYHAATLLELMEESIERNDFSCYDLIDSEMGRLPAPLTSTLRNYFEVYQQIRNNGDAPQNDGDGHSDKELGLEELGIIAQKTIDVPNEYFQRRNHLAYLMDKFSDPEIRRDNLIGYKDFLMSQVKRDDLFNFIVDNNSDYTGILFNGKREYEQNGKYISPKRALVISLVAELAKLAKQYGVDNEYLFENNDVGLLFSSQQRELLGLEQKVRENDEKSSSGINIPSTPTIGESGGELFEEKDSELPLVPWYCSKAFDYFVRCLERGEHPICQEKRSHPTTNLSPFADFWGVGKSLENKV